MIIFETENAFFLFQLSVGCKSETNISIYFAIKFWLTSIGIRYINKNLINKNQDFVTVCCLDLGFS